MITRWLRLHRRDLFAALGRLGATPVGAALNVLVVAIALALPTATQILIANAGKLAPALDDAADVIVYLEMQTGAEAGRALAESLAARPDVASASFVDRDEGLAEFQNWAGFGDALDDLPDNPLPHVIRVRPASDTIDEIDRLATTLAELDAAASVQLDRLWVERLQALLGLGQRAINITTLLLAIAVILIVGNTIRLEINNRRTEIEVLKLVGATDGFIRRPFLYTGLCLGGLGATAGCLIVGIGLWLLAQPVRDLARLYPGDFTLSGLSADAAGFVIAAGAVLGWAGAWIATARHLKAIEPA